MSARYAPVPSALRGIELLYNQIQGTATSGIVSQNNTTATTFNNIAADDFVVAAGQTWTVTQLIARGFYTTAAGGTAGTCQNADVSFWTNGADNKPGTVISTTNVVPTTDVSGVLTLNFAGVQLTSGTYWASVVCNGANLNLGVNSRWNWFYNTVQSQQPAQLRNDGGGFGVPAGWNSINGLGAGIGPDFDFSLSGSSSGVALFPELALSPTSIDATVETGGSTTATLTVANTGTADLTYSFPAFAALQRVRQLAALGIDVNRHERVIEASFGKGAEGLAPSSGNARQYRVGGPDAFGYAFIDSNEEGGPVFEAINIAATGTSLSFTDPDDGATSVTLPFTYSYYGTEYTSVTVGVNGAMTFTGTSVPFSNSATMPNPAAPNAVVAVWWDDLNSTATGDILTQTLDDGRFVVQWNEVPRFGSAEAGLGNTFQAIMSPDGGLVFQYLDINAANQGSATTGIENETGTVGLLVNANTAGYITDGLAVAFVQIPDFIADVSPASGTVAPGGSQAVTVTLNGFEDAPAFAGGGIPVEPGTYTRSLTLTTNDPDALSTTVPVSLTVTPAGPADPLEVTPNPVTETLASGDTGTETVTIENNTDAEITYSFPQYASLTDAPTTTRRVHAGLDLPKGAEDSRNGAQAAFRDAGGPDAFGYQWIDSDEPGGPVFNWTDITATGTAVTLGDDASTEVALPFTFPFYGADQTSVRIVSNGFLAFGGTSNAFSNAAIPTAAAPNNIIAGFWDDLNPATGGTIHHGTLNGDFVVQFTNVPRFGGTTGAVTFQMILSPTGAIRYQYLSVPTTNNSATVGIENADGTDGLQIAFNTVYAAANKAVLIQARPAFVTGVTPASGTIAANSSATVSLDFSAAGLLGGVYEGEIDLTTSIGDVALGVELTVVGNPTVTVNPVAAVFDDTIVGFTATEELTISNNGSSALEITDIASDNPAFTVSATTATIAPGASEAVTVTFTPTAPGAITGTLSITSNADSSPDTVPLSGTALAPPAFAAAPTSLSIEVEVGQSATGTVTLNNTGAGAGAFEALARLTPPAFNVAPPTNAAPASTGPERVRATEGATAPTVAFRSGDAIVSDGSFEAGNAPGVPNPFWTEASTNFGSPLCTVAACGTGTGTGPRTGTWWTWFGGAGAASPPEIGSMTQTVTIPSGTGELSFWLEIPIVAPTGTGFVRVTMDGTELFRATQTDNTPATYLDYREVVLDISDYADGGSHVLAFESEAIGGGVNFFIDDVSITVEEGLALSVSPASGDIAAGGSQVLTVTVDAANTTNDDAGTYQAQLVIETNDPANPTITVPVTITLNPIVSNEGGIALPDVATLYQPFPNPMASAATVRFALPEAAPVRLHVYDVAGRLVSTLVDGERAAGFHEVALDARQMASGTYVVRMQAGEVNRTLRVSVVR